MIATALTNLELFYERNMTSAIQYRKEKSSKQKFFKTKKITCKSNIDKIYHLSAIMKIFTV